MQNSLKLIDTTKKKFMLRVKLDLEGTRGHLAIRIKCFSPTVDGTHELGTLRAKYLYLQQIIIIYYEIAGCLNGIRTRILNLGST